MLISYLSKLTLIQKGTVDKIAWRGKVGKKLNFRFSESMQW